MGKKNPLLIKRIVVGMSFGIDKTRQQVKGMNIWILTTEIAENWEEFVGREISLGSKYSLVSVNEPIKLDASLIGKCKMLDMVRKNNVIYLLVEANCMESAIELQNSFIFKGMTTLPDFYDEQRYHTVLYIVTVKITNGGVHNFSQMLPFDE